MRRVVAATARWCGARPAPCGAWVSSRGRGAAAGSTIARCSACARVKCRGDWWWWPAPRSAFRSSGAMKQTQVPARQARRAEPTEARPPAARRGQTRTAVPERPAPGRAAPGSARRRRSGCATSGGGSAATSRDRGGRGRRRGGRRRRPRREERERIEVAVLVAGQPDPEMDIRHVDLRRTARADASDDRSLLHACAATRPRATRDA